MGNFGSTPTSKSESFSESPSSSRSPSPSSPSPSSPLPSTSQPRSRLTPYMPNCSDVAVVRTVLQNAFRGPVAPGGLPPELVDMIVDAAEYWPSAEVKLEQAMRIRQDGDREYLRTKPLCYDTPDGSTTMRLQPHRGLHPCRKIEFSISSHDQGWGGGPGTRGTYNGSFTWFDAYVMPKRDGRSKRSSSHEAKDDGESKKGDMTEREKSINQEDEREEHSSNDTKDEDDDRDGDGNDDSDNNKDDQESETAQFGRNNYFLTTPKTLQRNIVARRQTQTHSFAWHYLDSIDPDSEDAEEIQNSQGRGRATLDGRVVREMDVGDSISIWARARFPGWQNTVEGMRVRVFWAI